MQFTMRAPDDFHLHLRDDAALNTTVPAVARYFARAVVMPNLKSPIRTVEDAQAYYQRILRHLPKGSPFQPLMTLYLSADTTAAELEKAAASPSVYACKYYPQGATTHSEFGVEHFKQLYPAFEAMERLGLLLLLHGEVTDPEVDIFDREKYFIDRCLTALRQDFPALKVVLEHITTREAVEYVLDHDEHLAATITPHHLLLNRNDLFTHGLRPHHYCLPILKRAFHQEALIRAAVSGDRRFFLGTDSAPHKKSTKEAACGCAGIYSSHAAIELYAEVFEAQGALEKLEDFASRFGAEFYGLPLNTAQITLSKKAWRVPASLPFGSDTLIPFKADEMLAWSVG